MSENNVYVPAIPVSPLRPKSTGIAYLFLLLLGPFGAHKFYLRNVGWGILYLLTFGFALIGVVVDLFTLPSQVRDANVRRRLGVA